MARNWMDELARINRNTKVKDGDPIPAENILQALKDAEIPIEKQAEILGVFMDVNKDTLVGPPEAEKPKAEVAPKATLTLQQVIQMAQDPSKHKELQAIWNSMTDAQKAPLLDQIKNLKPVESAKSSQTTQLENLVKSLEAVINSNLPKRSKMLDFVAKLNPWLGTSTLKQQDASGKAYVDQIKSLLNANTAKVGTTQMPAAMFMRVVNSHLDQDKPIEEFMQNQFEHRIVDIRSKLKI